MNLNSSRLNALAQIIHLKKNYVLILKKRMFLIKEKLSVKSEYERNEIDITTNETLWKISVAQGFIERKEKELQVALFYFYLDLEEMSSHFEKVLEKAKRIQFKNDSLVDLLFRANWDNITGNIDDRIDFYKELKEEIWKVDKRYLEEMSLLNAPTILT